MGAENWSDPYGIVPESFREEFSDSDTLAEARPSSTPLSDRDRCPYCGSKQTVAKTKKYNSEQRKPGEMKCTRHGCRRHFDTPADETTILMTDDRTDPFSWIDREDLDDPDARGEGPLFASLDEETRIALAIVLYRPWSDAGPSLRELGELFPNSRYWVGERNREWKDGDHRDLVPEPTDERTDPEPNTDPPIDPSVAVARIGGDYEELVAERTHSNDASASVETAADGGARRSRWAAYGSD